MPFISDQEYAMLRGGAAGRRRAFAPSSAVPGAAPAASAPWRNAYVPSVGPTDWARAAMVGHGGAQDMGDQREVNIGGRRTIEQRYRDPVTGAMSNRFLDAGAVSAQNQLGGAPQAPPSTVPQGMRDSIDRQQAQMGSDWTFTPTPGAGGGYWRPNSPQASSAQGMERFNQAWQANQQSQGAPAPPPAMVMSAPPTAAATQVAAQSPPVTPPQANPQVNVSANEFQRQSELRANQMTPSQAQPQLEISQMTAKPIALASPGQGGAPIQQPPWMQAALQQNQAAFRPREVAQGTPGAVPTMLAFSTMPAEQAPPAWSTSQTAAATAEQARIEQQAKTGADVLKEQFSARVAAGGAPVAPDSYQSAAKQTWNPETGRYETPRDR